MKGSVLDDFQLHLQLEGLTLQYNKVQVVSSVPPYDKLINHSIAHYPMHKLYVLLRVMQDSTCRM